MFINIQRYHSSRLLPYYQQTKGSKSRFRQTPGTTISLQQQSMYQFCALYQVKEDGGIAGINCKDVQHYYIVHTLKRPRKDETKRCSRTKKKCSSCGLASHHEMMMTDPGRPRGLPLPMNVFSYMFIKPRSAFLTKLWV